MKDTLLSTSSRKGTKAVSRNDSSLSLVNDSVAEIVCFTRSQAGFRCFLTTLVLVLGALAFASNQASTLFYKGTDDSPRKVAGTGNPEVDALCPSSSDASNKADNYVESFFDEDYADPNKEKLKNVDEFIDNYRTTEFDAWIRTYEEVLEGSRHWKSKHYPKHVKTGDSIYESACGMGMNLIMTAEILQKEYGISDLTVYGNDYVQTSVDLAQPVLERILPSFGGRKGHVCQADSTNLGHIKNNTFDLVFTGYLSPLYDPLEMGLEWGPTMIRMRKLCEQAARDDDWKSKKLLEVASQRQNEWHNRWVSEMIRIAKPGSAVIVEQLRDPMCLKYEKKYGLISDSDDSEASKKQKQSPLSSHVFGQSRNWWKHAVQEYGWDVDPDSIQMEDETIFGGRYHLFMKKNG